MLVPLPKTKMELQQFLVLIGYCRTWIQDFSLLASPLCEFLTQESPNIITWTPEGNQSFQALKSKLTKAPALDLLNR